MRSGRLEAFALAALGAASFSQACTAPPIIIGDGSDSRCIEAHQMATSAFNARSHSLLWPVPRPARPGTKIILAQSLEDISGGGALSVDPSAFETIRPGRPGYDVVIYRRRNAASAPQFALVDSPFNWRGNRYTVYLLGPGDIDLLARQVSGRQPTPKPLLEAALAKTWTPPIVLTDVTGTDWIIDRGRRWDAMADWRVHAFSGRHLKSPCRISFGLPKEGGLSKLPVQVRRFAAAADEALGPGSGEGTLQQTASIRISVERGWANAALRPWAVRASPYVTRAEVDRGLTAWARINSRRRALHARIGRSLRRAEAPLAGYYAARFGERPAAARRLSHKVLDSMVRSYFVFHREK